MAKIHHAKILSQMKTFYEPYFKDWSRVYDSLMKPNQHCALLNKYFKDADKLINSLKLNTSEIVLGSNISLDVLKSDILEEIHLNMSEHATSNRHNVRKKFNNKEHLSKFRSYDVDYERIGSLNLAIGARFPSPKKMVHKRGDILPYYLMDLASLLPVISLNIQPDDCVLDMCSAPGGKAVAILQLLTTKGQLVCNEYSKTRLNRLKKVLNEYMPEIVQRQGNVVVTNWNGELFGVEEKCTFDKVIVDAPCSSERHVVQKEFQYGGWNIHKMKENAKLQIKLLLSALRTVKPGGAVAYSTCTMSPLENEDVVKSALDLAKKEGIKACSVDKNVLLDCTVDRFGNDTFYSSGDSLSGVLVLPNEFSNWGPMFFAKLLRLE